VALEEPPRAEVVELLAREALPAQRRDLALDLCDVRRQVGAGGPALEAVFDLGSGKMMQHDLHHRELVQIRVEQRVDDHPGWVLRTRGPSCYAPAPRTAKSAWNELQGGSAPPLSAMIASKGSER